MIQNSELIEWLKKKAETVTMPGARKMYQAAVKALEAQKYMVSRQVANVAICNACGKIDCDQVDKCEKLFTAQEAAVKQGEIRPGDEVERYVDGRYDGRAMFLAEDGDRWTCLFWTGYCSKWRARSCCIARKRRKRSYMGTVKRLSHSADRP